MVSTSTRCLLATLIYAFRDLLTRKISSATPSILVTLGHRRRRLADGCGGDGLSGLDADARARTGLALAVVAAMRHGEMTVIAPFRHVGLLWAVLLGYFVWGTLPNAMGCCGIALLIGAGLYSCFGRAILPRRAP